ncbi:hypothetical protein DACRYDRAFT_108778 [Dacryopinax primogenitus]|uniref:Uncharacterized protein n=1 Tax=Dacryopinax primogenitus (strain DJM 731) TaxID=1858805 RepID=M5FT33_DACPD|nr:uncharacterized protein DACRYDRAFT_108778 [Dacryopinax primogenitus]EJU00711.1 hypothetical protein DACRYDRAFT_108778 [Dacryopinax primogenitus]
MFFAKAVLLAWTIAIQVTFAYPVRTFDSRDENLLEAREELVSLQTRSPESIDVLGDILFLRSTDDAEWEDELEMRHNPLIAPLKGTVGRITSNVKAVTHKIAHPVETWTKIRNPPLDRVASTRSLYGDKPTLVDKIKASVHPTIKAVLNHVTGRKDSTDST